MKVYGIMTEVIVFLLFILFISSPCVAKRGVDTSWRQIKQIRDSQTTTNRHFNNEAKNKHVSENRIIQHNRRFETSRRSRKETDKGSELGSLLIILIVYLIYRAL